LPNVTQEILTIPAFAKLNWTLQVLGRRADGYHDIDTLLQTISLHDTLKFSTSDNNEIRLTCDDRSIPCDETNLVWRAGEALRKRYSMNRGAKIRLEKRIPSEAGLGGGSSDAAATLIALAQLWEIAASANDLLEIGRSLGSDVPFFFFGGTARATSRGELIEPLADAPKQHLLIIKPNASVSTARAYNLLNSRGLTSSNAKPILLRSQASHDSDSFDLNVLDNDFEAGVFQLEPEIERAKNALLKSGARAVMLCGSGSAVFGILENQDAQERAIQAIELETGWRAFPCKTVGRSCYQRAMGPANGLLARLFGENAGA
jgi:4-diphosphocytidyl-2-C-methyl-D-erythritol kinase